MTAARRGGALLGGASGPGRPEEGGSAWGLLFFCLLACASPAAAQGLNQLEIGKPAPAFAAKGIDGRPVSLGTLRGKPVVLEWTSPVCPFTRKKYDKGAMQALQAQARRDGFAWIAVNTSTTGAPGHLTPVQAAERIKAQHMTVSAFVEDDGGRLGRLYGAKATPQVFIVGADGRLLFQGGVDDDAFADAPPTAASAVKAALDDVAAHRPVRTPEVKPYGCPVEY